ncbi:flagellar biosynthesis anti-sigma factor FlgM [Sphingomonas spermidinifaciens]|uniref:Negative regulator of flagellin synthesis n=1 Tax=Sphingomonas spermidinifaciens TaxID=1141889 RepID=A0A2A4B3X4_9SPHN|nr:flagellar biosynthesis anti-sigma factor FlgM [Sphingomonas spermidinifaciens]PCD02479.1 flagellar biosynthesis anti-sigma factor FlgM [Sphingomonas spermidinifaciens]
MDPIGSKPIAKPGLAPVTPTAPVARVADGVSPQAAETVRSSAVAVTREMAAKPPVDTERVARIKKAVEDGSFPIVPSTIADRLLAFKLNWKPDDAA